MVLPENPQEILKLALQKAKEQPVLFWGSGSQYSELEGWPGEEDQLFVPVALSISLNASKFFEKLQMATSGLYFLESDNMRDLDLTRGVDYRNAQPKGICLILASPFTTKSEYLQALGRVRRHADEGQVFTLPDKMWKTD